MKSLSCVRTSKRHNSSWLRTEEKRNLYGGVYVSFEAEKEKLSPVELFSILTIKVLSTFTFSSNNCEMTSRPFYLEKGHVFTLEFRETQEAYS